MLMRFFLYSKNENDAIDIFEDCISCITNYVVERREQKLEPYWKFSDMYVVEETLKFNINTNKFTSFLKSISDKLLASEITFGRYMRNKVSMVNTIFDDGELHLIPKSEEDM